MEGVARDVDLMVEAKGKEQAVLMLYRIYGLESVEWGSLRPEKEVVGKEVVGKEVKGEAEEEGVGESPGKQRKTRGVKAKEKTVVDEDEDAEYDGALESPKRKTRGAKAKVKAGMDEDDEYTGEPGSPKKRTGSSRTKKGQYLIFVHLLTTPANYIPFIRLRRDRYLTSTSQVAVQTHFKAQGEAYKHRRDISYQPRRRTCTCRRG